MNKKSFYLLLFFCIALLCLFLYLIFKSFTTPPTTPSTPQPTPSVSPDEYYDTGDLSEPKEPEKAEEISKLIDKTPYYGIFFSFTYDLNTALFTVNIDPANESEGEKEFNKFLNQNGIPNKSYIIGLKTTNVPPPVSTKPAP